MTGANPVRITDPIYPHDYYTPAEIKELRNMLLDSEIITEDLRTFLRGRTFSRPRGVRRFVDQIQSPDRWDMNYGKETANIPHDLECGELFHNMFCITKEECVPGNQSIAGIVGIWRMHHGK